MEEGYFPNNFASGWGGSPNTGSSTASSTTGLSNYGYAALGINTITSILSGMAQTSAFKAKLKYETNAAIANSRNAVTAFELQQHKNREAIDNLNHILGDKLSERGLQAMKEEALLKVSAAETGTSNTGTTSFAVKEAFINEQMDRANIIASAREQEKNLLTQMDIQQQGVKNQTDSILLGGGISVGTNPLIAGLGAGLGVAGNTLAMLPMQDKVNLFGITPNQG